MSRIQKATGLDSQDLMILGAIAVGLYIWKNGTKDLAVKAGGAVADAVTGVITGGVSSVGSVAGLPGYDDVSNDPRVARWIIDHPDGGYLEASMYVTPVALVQGMRRPQGSGIPGPAGTKIAELFPNSSAIASKNTSSAEAVDHYDEFGTYLGTW